MNMGAGLFPFDLSRLDLNAESLTIAVFNGQEITAQHHRDSIAGIAVPRHSLAGSKSRTAHHRGSVMKYDLICHRDPYAASASVELAQIQNRLFF